MVLTSNRSKKSKKINKTPTYNRVYRKLKKTEKN